MYSFVVIKLFLQKIKKLGAVVNFSRRSEKTIYELIALTFAAVSKDDVNLQHGNLAFFLFDILKRDLSFIVLRGSPTNQNDQ